MKRATMLLAAELVLLAATTVPTMWAGTQDTAVTDQNLGHMISIAKTPADHEAIAAYYDREAAENKKKTELYRVSEKMYTNRAETAHFARRIKTLNLIHCSALMKSYEQAANEDRALAAGHREIAKKAEK